MGVESWGTEGTRPGSEKFRREFPPDSRIKWSKSGVFQGILGEVGHLPMIRPPTKKFVATPLLICNHYSTRITPFTKCQIKQGPRFIRTFDRTVQGGLLGFVIQLPGLQPCNFGQKCPKILNLGGKCVRRWKKWGNSRHFDGTLGSVSPFSPSTCFEKLHPCALRPLPFSPAAAQS